MKQALVMLSGGIDSAIALAEVSKTYRAGAIFFDYGQRSVDFELTSARQIARHYNSSLEVVDISGLKRSFLGLTPEPFVALGFSGMGHANCPHGLFGLAASYCISAGIEVLVTGMHKDDAEGLNDVKSYLRTWGDSISKVQNVKFAFHFPFIDTPKADVIKRGKALKVPYEKTRSCFSNTLEHCGVCIECVKRKGAFASSKVKDPTTYAK